MIIYNKNCKGCEKFEAINLEASYENHWIPVEILTSKLILQSNPTRISCSDTNLNIKIQYYTLNSILQLDI